MLRAKLTPIEMALLPAQQEILGNYPPEQEIKTRAYLVLAHAEFEWFIEDACRNATRIAQQKFAQGQSTALVVAMNSFHSSGSLNLPAKFSEATSAQREALDVFKRSDACFAAYGKVLSENNGIRQHNLVRLLGPLGIDFATLSPSFLLECDKFGALRGGLAHGKAQQVVDPFSEKTRVDSLEKSFVELAAKIAALA